MSKLRYVPILIMIVLGAMMGGIAFNAFLIPHKLLSGGVSGVALILNYIFELNPGVLIFIFNIPIFLAGYKFMDKEFILLSLVGMTVFSVSIDLFSFLKNVVYIEDTL
nr:YitT family protein [Clostridia bacterium]